MRTKLKRALFGVMAGIMVANTPLTTLAAYTPANEPDDTTGHSAETASDKEAKRDQEEKSILEQKDLYTYLGEMEEEGRKKILADLTDEQTYELVILLQYEYLDTFNQEQSLELYKETVDGYWKNIPELKTDEEKKEYESKLSDWKDTAFKYVDTEEKDASAYEKSLYKEKEYAKDLHQILKSYVEEKDDAEKQAESEEAYESLKAQIFSGGGINQDTSTDKKETPDSKDETSDTVVDDKESKGTDDSEGTEKKDETVKTPDESKDEQEPEQKDEQKNDYEGESDHTTADNTDSSEETAEDLTLTKKELKSLMNSENFDVKKFMKREYESRNFYPIYAGIKSSKKESFLADRTPEELYQIMLMSKYTLLQQYVKYAGMTIEKSDMSDLTAYLSDYQMILEQQMGKGSTLSEEQKQQLETEVLDVIAKADQLENIDSLAGYEEYLKQLDVKIDMTGLLDMFGKVDLTSEDTLLATVGGLLNYSYQLFGMEEEMNGEEVTPKPVTSSRRKARSVMVASTTPSNGSEVTIANGAYYFYVNTSNFLLDIANNGTGDKTNVDIWNAGQSGFGRCEQKWVVIRQSDGWYKIFGNYSRKCLDVYGGGTGTGQNINLYTDNGSASQKWKFYYYNGKYIVKSKLGTVLDVNGGTLANGTNVQTWSQNNSGAQLWRLQKITNDTIYLKPGNSTNGHGYLASAPINNMANAYQRIQYTGGTIYVMESWNVTSTVTLTSTSYSNSAASGVNLLSGCSLNFKRYSGFKGNLIVIQSNGNATFKNLTFDGNKGNVTKCYAMMWAGAGKIYLNNCTFQNANSYDNTSCVVSRVNLTIDNCTFKNNYSNREHIANCSAHLWIDKATANINGCTFQNNEKSGAVNLFYSKGIFKNCKFLNNGAGKTNDYASALGINAGDAELYDCDFTGNYATRDGGAIHLNNNPGTSNDNNRGHFYAEGCSFTNNGAGGGVAAIMLYDTKQTATIKDCTFTNNTASGYAGAIASFLQTKLILTGCTFTGNKATGTNANGGGVYIDSSQSGTILTATGNTFDGNSTPTTGYCAGGAVRVIKGATQFKQNIWKNNKSVWGAALDVQATASATLTDENMTYNTSNGQGGAVHNNGTMSVIAGYYAHNTSTSGGGAICSTGALTLTSDKSYDNPGVFEYNTAATYGGAVFETSQSGSVTQKLTSTGIQYRNNISSKTGGAVAAEYLETSGTGSKFTATLTGNTFSGNSCDGGDGGAVDLTSGVTGTLSNNTYESNTAKRGGALYNGGTTTLTDETMESNTVSDRGIGGAIDNEGTLTVNNGYFVNNSSDMYGGAVYTTGSLTLKKNASGTATGEFIDNSATDAGGAIYNKMVSQYIDCTVDSTGITYSGNTAAHGGAVYANEHTTFTSNGDTFESNEASVEGGAVNILSCGEFIMNNGSMKGNTAPKGSGVSTDGIFRMSGSAVINPDEDVYLYPLRYISVPAALTSDKVATVTPSDYTTGRVVVSNSYSEKGSVLEPKFTLTPKAGYFLRGGNKNGANDTDVVISENYPVTYDCGKTPNPTGHFSDGTNLDDEDVKEWGVDYELRTDKPTAKGYLFSGWNTEEDGSGDDYFPGDTYSENEALYLYAQWTPIKYTVAYNGNGSTSGSMLTQTFTYGKSYNLAANGFVRSNYHFAGWNTKADGSGTSYSDKQSVKNLATKKGTKVTLYAQWAKNTYTIRFHANGGAGSMADVTVPYDTVYYLPKNQFTLKGYRFDEWIDADHSMAIDDEGYITRTSAQSKSDVIDLYAQWTANKYIVAYNANGGSGTMAADTATYGSGYVTKENAFSRTGYTFKGWNEKADGTGTDWTNWIGKSWTWTYTKNITLYAQWTANQYQLTLNPNNGSFSDGTTAVKTLKPDLIYNGYNWCDIGSQKVSRTGYTFDGWYDKASGGEKVYDVNGSCVTGTYWKNNIYQHTGNLTVYAHWTAKNVTVTFHRNTDSNDTTTSQQTFTYDVAGQKFTDKGWSKTGYTLLGWSTDKNATNASYSVTNGVSNDWINKNSPKVDLYGVWTANKYTVAYNANGGSGTMATDKATYGAGYVTKANAFSRTGYTFVGWNEKADGTGTDWTSWIGKSWTWTYTKNITLYAQWTVNKYTLMITGDSGVEKITGNGTYNYGTIANVTYQIKPGYHIKNITGTTADGDPNGVWTGHTGKGGTVNDTWTVKACNRTAVVHTEPNTYTIKYDGNGSTGGSTAYSSHIYDVAKALTANEYTRTGYSFNGWNTKADGSGTAYADKASVKNLTSVNGAIVILYAQWSINSYTLTYNPNGGSVSPTSKSLTYNSAYGTLPTPTRKGYAFTGWFTAASGGTKVSESTKMGTGNITIYAHWRANVLRVNYYPNGATKVDNSAVMDGSGVSTITPDAQYRYDDFNYDATMPSYGLWDARRFIRTGYTSTNKYHLGSKDGTVLLDAGNNVFARTQDLATAAGVLSDLEKGNVSISIYADWKANTYTIKYNGNGNTGGSTADSSHTYDTAKGLTANGFTKTGYTFKNWNTKADGSGTSYADKASVKNLTATAGGTVNLYAQWTANKYTVAYNANGGTGTMANQELTYDKAATLNANTFKRTGYRFNGWNTKADGTGTSYADKASVKNLTASNGGTVTLYAKWYSAVPELEAKDATYYEGQDITKAMLLKNVTKASDVEDGDMAGKVIITKIEYSAGKLVDGKPQASYTKNWTNGMPDSEKLDTWFQQLPKEKAPVTHKITYQVTDLSGKTTTKTSTITVKYNEFPVIKAEDRYFTLEEAKSGKITKDVLLKEAIASGKLKAEDKEDGVISNKVTILDYKDTDFKNVNGNATVTVIFKVNDSMGPSGVGKETVCEVKVKIIDSGSDYWRDDDGTARKQVRFITQKYYDKNKDTDFHGMTSEEIEASSNNGGLNVMSKWYQNAAYKALLTGSFAKDAGTDYKISAEKAKELKQKIESSGIGNSKSSNALTDIYNSLK